MKGNECKEIIKKFSGITTLKKFMEELDKRYGKIEKQIPRKLEELKRLKWRPRGKLDELPNVEKMLSYVRTCQSFGAEINIGLVWVTEFANLLTEDNAIKLMATDGEPRRVIKLLEKISEEDENYRDIQPKRNEGGYKLNNFDRRGGIKCYICKGNHLFYDCPILGPDKSIEERETEVKKKGLCTKCFFPFRSNQCCTPNNRQYVCRQHDKNYNICKCRRFQKTRRNTNNVSDGTVQNNEIRLNNQENGDATVTNLITEVIELVDDYGRPHRVLCLYDHGNTNTGIDSDKANEIYGKRAFTHKINVDNFLTGTKRVSCNRRSIKIRKNGGPEYFEDTIFSVKDLNQTYERKSYTVPDAWMKEFNMVKHPTSAAGLSTLVVGSGFPVMRVKN